MNKRLYFLLIIILLVTSNSSNAQKLTITDQSKSALSLELKIDDYDIKEINDGKEILHEVVLSSITIPNDKGKPNLPSVNRFIAVPNNAKAKVIVNNYKKEILKNINIAPSRGIVSEYDTTNLAFIKDSDIYSKDELFPANIVSITENINMRGVETVGLNISPVQYNPVTKELVVYTEIELSIEYEGGDSKFGDDRLRSMYWDPILQHNILNYNSLPKINYSERFQQWIADNAEGAEYLIIIPDKEPFREYAQRLADYRKKQGIITKVYSLRDINTYSPDGIKNWITEKYNNWEIAPVAVCLLGDYNTNSTIGIPAFIIDYNEEDTFISDRPYSDINDDFLPDIAFSRLTAHNIDEADILINKQIDYEYTNPVMDENFYRRPLLTSAYQLEKWFQISSESINGFYLSKGKEPNRISMKYHEECNYTDELWSSADNTEQIVNYFGPNGLGYIPATPGETDGYIEYDSSDSFLLGIISQEPAFLLLNRDHGWYGTWGCPTLYSNNLRLLTNYDKLPFVLSINCASGAFNQGDYQGDCLSENFIKHENIGAVGIIAPTHTTHTYTNDSYLWGIMDFFENDFLPEYGTDVENNNNYMPAFANVSAKHFIFQQNFPNTYQQSLELTSNLFHSHCDAFLKLYTEIPQQIVVEHDDNYYIESHSFNINAPSGSTIALYLKESDTINILAVAEGNGSMQSVNISTDIIPIDSLFLTVTKSNHLRYEQKINITTNNAFVTIDDFNLYEDNNNLIFNQDTYIDINLKNIGGEKASAINLSLSCDSDKINISNNNNTIDEIGSNEVFTAEDAFYLNINDIIENGTEIVFTLTIEHDGIIHDEKFIVNVDAPSFKIISFETEEVEGNNNGMLEAGEHIKLTMRLVNNGNIASEYINAELISNDNYLDFSSGNVEFEPLDVEDYYDLVYEAIVQAESTNKEYSSLTLNINSGENLFKIDTYCNLCIVIDDFENGIIDESIWSNQSNTPWLIGCDIEGSMGEYCIYNNYTALLRLNINLTTSGLLSFRYKDESIHNLLFAIDNHSVSLGTNNDEWNQFEYFINAGEHTLSWIISEYSDNIYAYIDYITFRPNYDNVDEININDNIKIHPNPAEETVKLSAIGLQLSTVRIYNYLGTLVEEIEACSNEMEIDVSNYNPGLYLFNIESENKIISKKIIIK